MKKTTKRELATRLAEERGGTIEGKMYWVSYFMNKTKAELEALLAAPRSTPQDCPHCGAHWDTQGDTVEVPPFDPGDVCPFCGVGRASEIPDD